MALQVAFLGLGTMGAPMARNLHQAGFPLTVWNRTGDRAAPLVALGARVAATPQDAAAAADVVLYSLGDEAALEAVVFAADGVAAGIRRGAIAIDLSTSHPRLSRRQAETFAARGAEFLDAPVFGSRAEAEARQLAIVVGGSNGAVDRAAPVFGAIAASLHHVGGVGAGAAMGLVGSLIVALQLEALSEGLVLGVRAGLDPQQIIDIIQLPDFRSPLFGGMGANILARDFRPVFSLVHLQKDAEYIADLARELSVPLPASAAVREVIRAAMNGGHAGENASALVKAIEQQAAVEVRGRA